MQPNRSLEDSQVSFNLDQNELDKAVCLYAKKYRMLASTMRMCPALVFKAIRVYRLEKGLVK